MATLHVVEEIVLCAIKQNGSATKFVKKDEFQKTIQTGIKARKGNLTV